MMAKAIGAALPSRYGVYAACVVGSVASLCGVWVSAWFALPLFVFGALAALGTFDLFQKAHTVSRNYPIMAHFRYQLEAIGPEIRQYFIESDTEKRPFSREQRSLVYQRAKNVRDTMPFGSLQDMYRTDYQWLSHSLAPVPVPAPDFRVTVGAERARPYSASVLNISAMSFGALSGNAITALNVGARLGGFYHDTGEGSISPYHRQGGDLVWEIGSGYFGCRDENGRFSEDLFAKNAADEHVKMIEIKLSQGAKPGHGGVLPAAKVSEEIARTRGVPAFKTVVSPAHHSAFSTPVELMHFIVRLRELCGDKPVGIKLAIGHPWEWFALVKAMLQTGEMPDFIVVDGAEGGTGAAPKEFVNHVGMPLREALLLVHNTLVGAGLRGRIRVGAAGKVISAFDMARLLALGADWCNAARAFMFALGCIQARACNTDKCPSGVATQDPRRSGHLDVDDKSRRVRNFHDNTLSALAEMLAAAGLNAPAEIRPDHILSRVAVDEVKSLRDLHKFLKAGALLEDGGAAQAGGLYAQYWDIATADTFKPHGAGSAE